MVLQESLIYLLTEIYVEFEGEAFELTYSTNRFDDIDEEIHIENKTAKNNLFDIFGEKIIFLSYICLVEVVNQW